jgi:hypothetical protein
MKIKGITIVVSFIVLLPVFPLPLRERIQVRVFRDL